MTHPPQRRLVALDLMRGYYVGVLAAIHLDYIPSLLGFVDGRGALLVSEAEGFFMISGLLVGLLRRRDLEKYGVRRMTLRSWKRGLQLYVVAVPLTLLFTLIGRLAVEHGHPEVKVGLDTGSSWPRLIYHTLTFHYTYGWADFLTYYVPMFLLAPLAVWLLSKRLWPLILVLAYAGFWLPSHYHTSYISPFLQWGVYFFVGCVAGYHWYDIRELMSRLPPLWNGLIRYGLIAATVALYVAGLLLIYRPHLVSGDGMYYHLFENNRLGLLRPFAAPVSVAGTYLLIRRYEEPISRTVGKILIPFGRNSLYVYVAQSFVVFLVPFAFKPHDFLINTVFDATVIAIIYLGVRTRFLAFLIPRT
ncbi:MAG TPA: OpgC domain-containing protein [Actinospica sp.]|nr:OpgC domain-containing protein [Actinospica sp.]